MTLKIVDGGKSPSAGKQFASEDNDGNEDTAGANATIDRRRLFKPVLPAMLHKHNALGRLATFEVKVMFRQNASWQGMARWVEEEASEDFASTLELMY